MMPKSFCDQIDQELLVEQYVVGKLSGDLLDKFEQHITVCAKHANAVALEKALRRGVREFARSELKARIKYRVHKREDMRVMILRFAAFLFVAVITPLILYYQFAIVPDVDNELAVKNPVTVDSAYLSTSQSQELQDENDVQLQPISTAAKISENKDRPAQTRKEVTLPVKTVDEVSGKSADISERLQPETPVKLQSKAPTLQESALEPKPVSPQIDALEQERFVSRKQLGTTSTAAVRGGSGESSLTVIAQDTSLKQELEMAISRQLAIYEPEIQTCISGYLATNDLAVYSIQVEFQIQAQGNIEGLHATESIPYIPEIEKCILEKINKWKFQVQDTPCQVRKIFKFTQG
jgi:hypothetical protein